MATKKSRKNRRPRSNRIGKARRKAANRRRTSRPPPPPRAFWRWLEAVLRYLARRVIAELHRRGLLVIIAVATAYSSCVIGS